MRRTGAAWVVVALLTAAGGVGSGAVADGSKPATRMSRDLAALAMPSGAAAAAAGQADGFTELPFVVAGDWVTIDAVAAGDAAVLEAELRALGARDTAIAGRLVSARLPLAAIPSLDGVASLQFAQPAYQVRNAGTVTSQGDRVMRADTARATFGLDGSGVVVGVLSDSFGCQPGGVASDVITGDLPAAVTVLQDDPGCGSGTDEGRAMLQIVHDVAPGAGLAFATATTGQAGFANNIRALRDAGADVIVDDVIYLSEPMFQDGAIAQAVDEVVASGVAYFSAAGNSGRRGYERPFAPGAFLPAGAFGPEFLGGIPHTFSSGSVRQRISGPGGGSFTLVLQWDSPSFSVSGAPGTQNDLDVYLLASNGLGGFVVVAAATTNNLASGDPVEILPAGCPAPPGLQCVGFIMIVNHAGLDPGRFKYVLYASNGTPTLSPAISNGTIYGHANAAGAVAVGAAFYKTPTSLESFSSGGTTPVLFDTAGSLLTPADPRQFKPELVAPDGVDTTFFGFSDPDASFFPNFFGTSAAAPHAAAVAALLRQAVPTLTPLEVRTALEETAQNMGPTGFDTNSGFGLIRAAAALDALHVLTTTTGPGGTPNPTGPGGTVSLSVGASDSFGHGLSYAWTQTCTGIAKGTFDDAAVPTPTWTAPANATGATRPCVLKVTVSDGHGFTTSATYAQSVLSVPRIASLSPASAPVGAPVVIKGLSLTGATDVTFTGGVTVAPSAVTPTSVTVTVPAGALTGPLSVTTAVGNGASTATLKVLPRITGFGPAGVVAGSATVVIVNGTTLRAATGEPVVKIGASIVPGGLVTSTPTQITFTVPTGPVTGKISVTTRDGTSTSATSLTVIYAPKPRAFAPPAAGVGTSVTIGGTNLMATTEVTFTGGATVVPTTVTATSLRVTVPAGALTGPVSVTNPAGTAATTASFKVRPRITGFAPAGVVAGSATEVIVSGTNLRAATGEPTVKVGAFVIPGATVVSSTLTQVRFPVPPGAVTGKIGVTTGDGTAASATSLTVVYPPTPKTFSPAVAAVGTVVTIGGTNLMATTEVTFAGGVVATPTTVTPTSLRIAVPPDALTGPVSVTNPAGTAATTASLKVLPKITGFAPASAVAGSATAVVVSGTNMRAATGEPTVKVGAFVIPMGAMEVSTTTEVRFRVPLGAVTGKIGVTTLDGTTTSASNLVVVQPPKPMSFVPAAVAIGASVTIKGTNLTGVTAVTFTGAAPVVPTSVTASSVRVTVPADALTGVVSVSNPIGTGTTATSLVVTP